MSLTATFTQTRLSPLSNPSEISPSLHIIAPSTPVVRRLLVLTSRKDLATVASLKCASTSHVILADLDRTSTGAYADAKNRDGTVSKTFDIPRPLEYIFANSEKDLHLWQDALHAMAHRTKPLDSLEIHSTAQWNVSEVVRKYGLWFLKRILTPKYGPSSSNDCFIPVRSLVLSGLHMSGLHKTVDWVNLFDVQDRVTLRGCQHLFWGETWAWLLSTMKSSPHTLHLVGGHDMDGDWSWRWCLFNIACIQRNRFLKGMKPFKSIIMHFPISSSGTVKVIRAAWNDLPCEHRAGAELHIDTTVSVEFKGPVEEERRYQLGSPSQDTLLPDTKGPLSADIATAATEATRIQASERSTCSPERRVPRKRQRCSSETDLHRCPQEDRAAPDSAKLDDAKLDGGKLNGGKLNGGKLDDAKLDTHKTQGPKSLPQRSGSVELGASGSIGATTSCEPPRGQAVMKPAVHECELPAPPSGFYSAYPCGCFLHEVFCHEDALRRHPNSWMGKKDEEETKAEMRLTIEALQVMGHYFGKSTMEMEHFCWLIEEDMPDQEKEKLAEERRRRSAIRARQKEKKEQKRRKKQANRERVQEEEAEQKRREAAAEQKRLEEEEAEQKRLEEEQAEQKRRDEAVG